MWLCNLLINQPKRSVSSGKSIVRTYYIGTNIVCINNINILCVYVSVSARVIKRNIIFYKIIIVRSINKTHTMMKVTINSNNNWFIVDKHIY